MLLSSQRVLSRWHEWGTASDAASAQPAAAVAEATRADMQAAVFVEAEAATAGIATAAVVVDGAADAVLAAAAPGVGRVRVAQGEGGAAAAAEGAEVA